MKPMDIFEYKRKWMEKNPNPVTFHSDKQDQALAWCKLAINPESYRLVQWTDTYQHTMCFESFAEAQLFDHEINYGEQ